MNTCIIIIMNMNTIININIDNNVININIISNMHTTKKNIYEYQYEYEYPAAQGASTL